MHVIILLHAIIPCLCLHAALTSELNADFVYIHICICHQLTVPVRMRPHATRKRSRPCLFRCRFHQTDCASSQLCLSSLVALTPQMLCILLGMLLHAIIPCLCLHAILCFLVLPSLHFFQHLLKMFLLLFHSFLLCVLTRV